MSKAGKAWYRPLEPMNICHLCQRKCKEWDSDTTECLYFIPKERKMNLLGKILGMWIISVMAFFDELDVSSDFKSSYGHRWKKAWRKYWK